MQGRGRRGTSLYGLEALGEVRLCGGLWQRGTRDGRGADAVAVACGAALIGAVAGGSGHGGLMAAGYVQAVVYRVPARGHWLWLALTPTSVIVVVAGLGDGGDGACVEGAGAVPSTWVWGHPLGGDGRMATMERRLCGLDLAGMRAGEGGWPGQLRWAVGHRSFTSVLWRLVGPLFDYFFFALCGYARGHVIVISLLCPVHLRVVRGVVRRTLGYGNSLFIFATGAASTRSAHQGWPSETTTP